MPLRLRRQRPRPSRVLLHSVLHQLEDVLAHHRLVDAGFRLAFVANQSCVKGVVEDPPDGCCCKQPGASNKVPVVVNVLMHVTGAQALVVQPGRQLCEGSRARGVPAKQLPNGLGLVRDQVDAAEMLGVAPAFPLPPLLHPAGLIAERQAAQVLALVRPLVLPLLDMLGQRVAEVLGHGPQHLE